MLADCYNKFRCVLRFLFQGSGYTEAFNSLFRNVVKPRGAPMSRVPAEMLRVTERYFREHRDQRHRVSRVQQARIEATGLLLTGSQLQSFIDTFTSYSIKLWYERSLLPSREWRFSGFLLRPMLLVAPESPPRGPSICQSVDFTIRRNITQSTAQHTVWPVVLRG